MSEMSDGVAWCAASHCPKCGLMVSHKPEGGPQRRHLCALRVFRRARWRGYLHGWDEGYRFARNEPREPVDLSLGD